jgi:hypothetical protein
MAAETELRRAFTASIEWSRLDTQQRRAYLESLTRAPPAAPGI